LQAALQGVVVGDDIFAIELEYVGVAVLINVQVPDACPFLAPQEKRRSKLVAVPPVTWKCAKSRESLVR
jgi:hypothetical protein